MQAVTAASSSAASRPAIVVVPLSKDGCVDTEVDVPQAIRVIDLGGTNNE
jgi:hypothetical protein